MKNTIYNAIQKQLIIDDSDSSISYEKSSISSEAKFIINDLYELNDIYKSGDDIFKYDTSGSVSLIFADGSERTLKDSLNYDSSISFIKLMTPKLEAIDSDIIIPATNTKYKKTGVSWLFDREFTHEKYRILPDKYQFLSPAEALTDLKGYKNTQLIIKRVKDNEYISAPAAVSCSMIHISLKNGDKYQGYLPALGQLNIIADCQHMINHILETFKIKYIPVDWLWSSTECTELDKAWLFDMYTKNYWANNKGSVYNALPLFHKM